MKKRRKRSSSSNDTAIAVGAIALLWLLARRKRGLLEDLKDQIQVVVDKTSQQGGHAEGSSPID